MGHDGGVETLVDQPLRSCVGVDGWMDGRVTSSSCWLGTPGQIVGPSRYVLEYSAMKVTMLPWKVVSNQ